MVFRQTRIRSLTARVEGIYHISGLSEFALGCLKVVMASAVAMKKDHRLTYALRGIEDIHTVYMSSSSIAFIVFTGI